jgi:hypothetical protein
VRTRVLGELEYSYVLEYSTVRVSIRLLYGTCTTLLRVRSGNTLIDTVQSSGTRTVVSGDVDQVRGARISFFHWTLRQGPTLFTVSLHYASEICGSTTYYDHSGIYIFL